MREGVTLRNLHLGKAFPWLLKGELEEIVGVESESKVQGEADLKQLVGHWKWKGVPISRSHRDKRVVKCFSSILI